MNFSKISSSDFNLGGATELMICDGSCLRNPGCGGWAYAHIILKPQGAYDVTFYSGSSHHTTNNIMELTAVLNALKDGRSSLIYTDSSYVVHGINFWINAWRRSGWKTSQSKPVKNVELWREIDKLSRGKSIKWMRGHGTIDDGMCDVSRMLVTVQSQVDELARRCAEAVKPLLTK